MVEHDTAERVGVVTGASAGIGLYTALGLARTGMRVVMTGRDPGRTEAARRFVAERVAGQRGGAQVETALADFASLVGGAPPRRRAFGPPRPARPAGQQCRVVFAEIPACRRTATR